MCWLILHPLGWAKGCQATWYVFLGVSLKVSWEEIHIWISRLSEDHPPGCGGHPGYGAKQDKKGRGSVKLLPEPRQPLLLPLDPGSQAFGPDCMAPLAFWFSGRADGTLRGLTSITCKPVPMRNLLIRWSVTLENSNTMHWAL